MRNIIIRLLTISFTASMLFGLCSLSLNNQDIIINKISRKYQHSYWKLSACTAIVGDKSHQNQEVYRISGLSCNKCVQRIVSSLCSYDSDVTATLNPPILRISSTVPVSLIREAVKQLGGDYDVQRVRLWGFDVFLPVISIHVLILSGTIIISLHRAGVLNYHTCMRHYMAGYLIVFSLFKTIDLDGFVRSFQQYDIIAKRFRLYGYLYPFIQMLLGVLYAFNVQPILSNAFTTALKAISAYGVWKALRSPNNGSSRLTCACLGSTFRIPISYISLAEDIVMAAMALTSSILCWS